MSDALFLDPEAARSALAKIPDRLAGSVIGGERPGKLGKGLKQHLQRHRLSPHAFAKGGIDLRLRNLNRRNHQIRVRHGDSRDV